MSDTVLIVGGGEWQMPLIEKARFLGNEIICATPDSGLLAHSDVKEIIQIDVRDADGIVKEVQNKNIKAVISDQTDIAVPTVAKIAEKLSLPGIGVSASRLFTNKALMRDFCRLNGLRTPEYYLCENRSQVNIAIDTIGFPCVVKPPASQSSRGVTRIDTGEQVERAVEEAVKHSSSQQVLVERYLDGPEFTVDGIKYLNAKHQSLAISIKEHFADLPMVAKKLTFSAQHTRYDYDNLREIHDQLIGMMGLSFGLTHAEYKFVDGHFYLIEVAARGGGTRISSDIVPLQSGIDNYSAYIQMAKGHAILPREADQSSRCVILSFLEFESGIISHIAGVDTLKQWPNVKAFGLNVTKGSRISPALDDRSRHGYVIVQAESVEEAERITDDSHRQIKVSYE